MSMTITFEGRDWELDDDHVGVQQAMVFHLVHGLTLRGWMEGIKELDPRAIQCTYWLMLQQNGIEKPLKDLDFDAIGYMGAYVEALQAEKERKEALEAEKEPDPTQDSRPATKTPRSPGSSTSPSAKSGASTSSSSPGSAASEPPT
jgi:hypothetical protein